LQTGWAEQSPEMWWQEVVNATAMLRAKFSFCKKEVGAIGISYQMHSLVLVDKHQNSLRNAII
jgi:xylulokinase